MKNVKLIYQTLKKCAGNVLPILNRFATWKENFRENYISTFAVFNVTGIVYLIVAGGPRMTSRRIHFKYVRHAASYSCVLEAPIFALICTLIRYLRTPIFIKILDVLDLHFQGQSFDSPHWWVERMKRFNINPLLFHHHVGHKSAMQWHIRRRFSSATDLLI